MTEEDQKLHRLAALAAEHELKWAPEWPGGGCLMRRVIPEPEPPFSKWVPWSPLNDDGDALRLAVALNLGISIPVHKIINAEVISFRDSAINVRVCGSDPYSSTRRAIFLAAVEIGRSIEQQARLT